MAFMRHNNNGRRHNNNFHRNRNGNGGQQQQGQSQGQGQRRTNRVNHVFESNGPDGRIRGTAQQIVEKYTTMARDASVSGDKVLSLNYLQHAEHYQRLWNEIMEETNAIEREREQQRQQQQPQGDASTHDAAEGAAPGDQPTHQQQPQQQRPPREPREPREPRAQNRDNQSPQPSFVDDENALPNFLQVPITTNAPTGNAAESTASAPRTENRPPRARRPNPAPAAPADDKSE